MKNHLLIAFLFLSCFATAQQVEPVRYEMNRWNKEQGFHFQPFGENSGLVLYETDKTDKGKRRLWNFASLDTALYETRSDLIPLPDKLKYTNGGSNERFAAFLFVNDGNKKAADSLDFLVVAFDKKENAYRTFWDKWPEKSVPLSVEVADGTMMLALNNRNGNGALLFYDLSSEEKRSVTPSSSASFVFFQTATSRKQHRFVVAVKEFENKRFVSTSFLVYSSTGGLLSTSRYENIPNAALGRMGFRFDESGNLIVIGTLERETGRKVKLEGLTENFDKESLGVVWIRCASSTPESRVYLFKDMPEIEYALSGSDRVRVREERLKKQKNEKITKGEIAFQFLTPRLTDFGDLTVFAAEAFMPYYHTETRTGHGYYGYYGGYGSYPYTYTVFDGYDFFSEIILAFDRDGNLKWQQSVKFDNELTYDLFPHAAEGACYDELVVASPYRNKLRYTAFDANGLPLMGQQEEKLAPKHGADYVEDEYFAQIAPWYGSRFLIYGSQIIQNSTQPKARRTVFYLQKVQYD
ncbi:MAG: hypothetical protein IJQ11_13920 [Bacteroidales bacterium]|nr:hypothetical protein [Bacteroidales bacterium]